MAKHILVGVVLVMLMALIEARNAPTEYYTPEKHASPTTPYYPPPSPSTPTVYYPPTKPSPKPAPPTKPYSKPSHSYPPPSYTPTPSSNSGKGKGRCKCKNKNYPHCYNMEHVCPSSCPHACEIDCVTCKPICKCDKPGAVCQDPRFIGGDGVTFYFHGKRNHDFCLLSDSNLHINAHFIGKRNQNMKRDFTWVQSIAILFGKHQLYIGAQKTSTWDDATDRVEISFDGKSIALPESDGAQWKSTTAPYVYITRLANTNNVILEVEGIFKITAKVVPITEEESNIHNYGINKEDTFAHLDLGFKFLSLSNGVSGVLGQTYRPDYVSKVKIGANMPIMGGDKLFETSSLFATDCAVARFTADTYSISNSLEDLPMMSCASGVGAQGVVCKK